MKLVKKAQFCQSEFKMCSQYEVQLDTDQLKTELPELVLTGSMKSVERLLPSKMAPVIVLQDQQLRLVKMKFSLVPSWSKEPKVKFATHNARIESVHEKPTWKKPFLQQHCVVPLTGFFESVYEGPHQGHIIEFKQTSENYMYAAGIFDHWHADPDSTKHFFSYSILTEEPTKFILENGHDRTPIFLNPKNVKDWCSLQSNSFDEVKNKLTPWIQRPNLKTLIERPLKAGWEKRR